MKGEVEACQQIAQQTGILVDPMYTLKNNFNVCLLKPSIFIFLWTVFKKSSIKV
jgi:hypothetical protein